MEVDHLAKRNEVDNAIHTISEYTKCFLKYLCSSKNQQSMYRIFFKDLNTSKQEQIHFV